VQIACCTFPTAFLSLSLSLPLSLSLSLSRSGYTQPTLARAQEDQAKRMNKSVEAGGRGGSTMCSSALFQTYLQLQTCWSLSQSSSASSGPVGCSAHASPTLLWYLDALQSHSSIHPQEMKLKKAVWLLTVVGVLGHVQETQGGACTGTHNIWDSMPTKFRFEVAYHHTHSHSPLSCPGDGCTRQPSGYIRQEAS
jgi:hypothetical protein